jgi:hypothetical protein
VKKRRRRIVKSNVVIAHVHVAVVIDPFRLDPNPWGLKWGFDYRAGQTSR